MLVCFGFELLLIFDCWDGFVDFAFRFRFYDWFGVRVWVFWIWLALRGRLLICELFLFFDLVWLSGCVYLRWILIVWVYWFVYEIILWLIFVKWFMRGYYYNVILCDSFVFFVDYFGVVFWVLLLFNCLLVLLLLRLIVICCWAVLFVGCVYLWLFIVLGFVCWLCCIAILLLIILVID